MWPTSEVEGVSPNEGCLSTITLCLTLVPLMSQYPDAHPPRGALTRGSPLHTAEQAKRWSWGGGGVISWSLANDSKLIHQVRDSLCLLVLGVSNFPSWPRGLCKLKICLPWSRILPAGQKLSVSSRQWLRLRAEPGVVQGPHWSPTLTWPPASPPSSF